ncbi:hypothetical protein FRC06_010743, partial [Ceratobasidium sp. 370]
MPALARPVRLPRRSPFARSLARLRSPLIHPPAAALVRLRPHPITPCSPAPFADLALPLGLVLTPALARDIALSLACIPHLTHPTRQLADPLPPSWGLRLELELELAPGHARASTWPVTGVALAHGIMLRAHAAFCPARPSSSPTLAASHSTARSHYLVPLLTGRLRRARYGGGEVCRRARGKVAIGRRAQARASTSQVHGRAYETQQMPPLSHLRGPVPVSHVLALARSPDLALPLTVARSARESTS